MSYKSKICLNNIGVFKKVLTGKFVYLKFKNYIFWLIFSTKGA